MGDEEKKCYCGGACTPEPGPDSDGLDRRGFLQRAALLAGGVGIVGGALSAEAAGDDLSHADASKLDTARRQAHTKKRGRASKYPMPVDRDYNGAYAGTNLNRVAFPIGGIGAGMFCIEGTGAISHMSVRNRMEFFHEPSAYAAICVKGSPNTARVLEGPIPDWKPFGNPGTGNGGVGTTYGFPRFREAAVLARFPFATINLKDEALPLDVALTGWSPFIPGNADDSSLPAGTIEYTFTNTSNSTVDAVFSVNTKNFMATGSSGKQGIAAFPNGFQLWNDMLPQDAGTFAVFVDADDAVVDHCWFRGGWWDAMTLAWRNVADARLMENPPIERGAPGASLFVPFDLAPGASRTIRLMTVWYAGNTNLRAGAVMRSPFKRGAARGAAEGQQEVTGFLGKKLINSFHPYGDGATGALTSPAFTIKDKFVHFLIAGGTPDRGAALQLVVDGEVVRTAAGKNTEQIEWQPWKVGDLKRKEAVIRIADEGSGFWGHVNVDHIIFSDRPIGDLTKPGSNELKTDRGVTLFEDFESKFKDRWTDSGGNDGGDDEETFYRPWYVSRFENVGACRDRYDGVRRNPFNEYECGHWYARAMSSYGLLQGLTGARYDAVEKTLYIDSKVGAFRSFLSTNTGFGTAGLRDGKPFLEVKYGAIDVARFVVAGKEVQG